MRVVLFWSPLSRRGPPCVFSPPLRRLASAAKDVLGELQGRRGSGDEGRGVSVRRTSLSGRPKTYSMDAMEEPEEEPLVRQKAGRGNL